MIDPTCSPEVEGILRYLESTGVPHRCSSTYRPGAITAAGNPSRHGKKLAVDLVGLKPSVDSTWLAIIFQAFEPVERYLAELIYSGPQAPYNIKYGKRVGQYARAIHHNHVHVAVDRGVLLDLVAPDRTVAPLVAINPAPNEEDLEEMSEPMDGIGWPGGGAVVLTKDGGIRAYNGAPFYGSVPALKPENRTSDHTFLSLRAVDGGYVVVGASGAEYRFDAATWAEIQAGNI